MPDSPSRTKQRSIRGVLEDVTRGYQCASDARHNLRGLLMPNEPAEMVKRGRWAVDGGYETGARGLRAAARDALALMDGEL